MVTSSSYSNQLHTVLLQLLRFRCCYYLLHMHSPQFTNCHSWYNIVVWGIPGPETSLTTLSYSGTARSRDVEIDFIVRFFLLTNRQSARVDKTACPRSVCVFSWYMSVCLSAIKMTQRMIIWNLVQYWSVGYTAAWEECRLHAWVFSG